MIAEPRLVAEGRRLCDDAAQGGLAIRMLGGTAIWLRSPDAVRQVLTREFADLDLVTRRADAKSLRTFLEARGYVPDKMFNATQGTQRLYYTSADASFHIDVFIENFTMSHQLQFGARLTTEPTVLPAAELLLTKLQVAELNRKDSADTVMLLLGHELADTDGPGHINVREIASVCADDWGLYTTATDNLIKTQTLIDTLLHDAANRATARSRVAALLEVLQEAPKSRGWRRRSRLGRRIRWYDTPDEV